MSFTYNLENNIGKLRLELADTNEDDYTFGNEELQYFLDKANQNILWAKVYVCEAKAMSSSELTGIEIEAGDTRVKGGVTSGNNWLAIAKELRTRLESGLAHESPVDVFATTSGIYKQDRVLNEKEIEEGILLERDFYDYYNESGVRGGEIANGDSDENRRAD